jgi:hypothetical protein
MIENKKQEIPYPWNQLANPTAKVNAPIDEVSGHGLYSTKWKGCRIIYDF